jgi:hypothetical protein
VSVTNSLATQAPDVAALWDCERNDPVTPHDVVVGSGKVFWFFQAEHDGGGAPRDESVQRKVRSMTRRKRGRKK